MGRGSGTVAMVALTAGLTLGGCGGGERARDVGAAAERVPQSLVHSPDVYGLGLTGDAALLATDGSRLTITRMPLRGGADVRILRSPELVGGGLRVLSLGASDAVVGATFTPDDDEEGGPRSGLYGGPATGPLRQLEPARKRRPGVYEPRTVDADGDLLFVGAVGEVGRGRERWRATVRRTDGSVQRVDLPPQATVITFAGDLVAYAIPAPQRRHGAFDDHPPQRVVVRRWRTGTRVASGRIPAGVANLDLSPAGALAVGESKGGVVELRPGRPPRRLARNGPSTSPGVPPVYAGERLVFVRSTRAFGVAQLMIASPRRGARPFGVPAPAIGSVTADPRRVLWTTGDCVLLAGVQAPAATAPAAGPCPRTEITFGRPLDSQRSTLRPGGLVPVVVDCVTAAAPGCRGTLRLTSGGAGTKPLGFTIPPGARRRLLVRLAPGFEAALRRGDCCPRELTIVAAAKDPDGRRSEYRGKLLLAMGD